MLSMIGAGPFLTIPLIIQSMQGPQSLLAWIAGAPVALADGLVWAELGAALPRSGGGYQYLLEAYGPRRPGRLMSFLFLWQTIIAFPLTMASGAVGFAYYAQYLVPSLGPWQMKGAGRARLPACGGAGVPAHRPRGPLGHGVRAVVFVAVGWVIRRRRRSTGSLPRCACRPAPGTGSGRVLGRLRRRDALFGLRLSRLQQHLQLRGRGAAARRHHSALDRALGAARRRALPGHERRAS